MQMQNIRLTHESDGRVLVTKMGFVGAEGHTVAQIAPFLFVEDDDLFEEYRVLMRKAAMRFVERTGGTAVHLGEHKEVD